MDALQDEIRELRLDDLEPFPLSHQTYEGGTPCPIHE